jgi:hypothetical protein
MKIELDNDAFAVIDERIDTLTHSVAEDVADDARHYCPGNGELYASIAVDDDEVSVGTDHWSYVEYGTPPHVIRPSTKQALWWPGAAHPVRGVHHPGTPEQAFMRRALYKKRGGAG